MEELKLLIGMVSDLPAMAIWVLAGYLLYKLVVVGSIFGVIKFCVDATKQAYLAKLELKNKPVEAKLGLSTVNEDMLLEVQLQLARLFSHRPYIYTSDVARLKKAINLLEESEGKDGKK
jgi:hypothetical protein